MDNRKMMAFKEMIRNKIASGKNFTEAWVSHIPDDPTEHGVEELSEENLRKLIEEDDATYIEPGDSASQVGSLARQVSQLLKAVRQDPSVNGGNGPDKPLPRRLRAVLEQLAGNSDEQQRLKDKPPKVPRKNKDLGSKTNSPVKESHHFAVPALPSLTTTISRSKKSSVKKPESAATNGAAAGIPLLPAQSPELPEVLPEAIGIAAADTPSQVDKASSSSRKSSKSRKSKQIFMPVSNVIKTIQRYSASSGNIDQNFVNFVSAAGVVYTRKVIEHAERIARKNGHDFVHTSDMLEVFKMEHGKTLTESHLKRLEELMPDL